MNAADGVPEWRLNLVIEDLDTLHTQLIVALLSTICIAIHTACAVYAVQTQMRRGWKGARKWLLFATAALYIATAAAWSTSLVGQFQSVIAIKSDLLGEDSFASVWITIQDYVGSGALTISVFIGDSIVWWRVWVLWNKNRLILIISLLVLFATLGLGVASYFVNGGGLFFTGRLGLTVIVLSLFSNLASTLLVGYKSWKHRMSAKSLHFTRVSSVNQVQRALMLLFESDIVYCILWTLVLSSEVWIITPNDQSKWLWTNIMEYFVEGCLVALVGIYPTLIIIVIALNKSKIEQQCTTSFVASAGLAPAALPLIEADIGTYSSEMVEGDARRRAAVLIGLSRDSDDASALTSTKGAADDV
ncbi:hypothetical protein GSI_09813 [Ganoderma sinense ZZ0214-1]|uniref:Uncharacterized protein n=1 Tax=Ganoderma sinense ZZ0214-1 TaxID=1077348 RepID=A0A2G8S2T3_9APHY|nr:hypothetical protein GSI_09813 [Ganoderma sinense ZZ0214-1]